MKKNFDSTDFTSSQNKLWPSGHGDQARALLLQKTVPPCRGADTVLKGHRIALIARSLIQVGLSHGERRVPVTNKATSLNCSITVEAILLGSRIGLRAQIETMTGYIYRDIILKEHLRLFRGAMSTEFVDDNTRLQQANTVKECLPSTPIEWRAFSPGLIRHSMCHTCLANEC
ncbi:DDE_3 domain-containing protein [Trichonephila clavipes]|uniref:DDE_3 domain-containing protein n=1 Tax=Trichonephila clavipes TaxID=2585209 RepID=A0A8X6SHS0_TRICX|nr:DDE_3 domain-containing protein [Trichonephila clavipes]